MSFIAVVLVSVVIVLIIRHKRKSDAVKPFAVKSFDEEANHTYELIYPNPTYQDHEFSVKLTK